MEQKLKVDSNEYAHLKFKFKERPSNIIEVMLDGVILGNATYVIQGHRRIYRSDIGTFDRRWMMAIQMYKNYYKK